MKSINQKNSQKLIKKTNCEKVEESDINKRINKHYISYSRDSKLKELLK